ncbi:MAG: cytochrome C oxidase subunit IV family protein [Nitriliruptoraceae bacterium]
MSSTDAPERGDAGEGHADHPTPRQYVRIAIVLAVLTALEVSTYFFDFGAVAIPLLIVLMIAKFLYVVGWFMHLKFDALIFRRLMSLGLAFALVLYAITALVTLYDSAPVL